MCYTKNLRVIDRRGGCIARGLNGLARPVDGAQRIKEDLIFRKWLSSVLACALLAVSAMPVALADATQQEPVNDGAASAADAVAAVEQESLEDVAQHAIVYPEADDLTVKLSDIYGTSKV